MGERHNGGTAPHQGWRLSLFANLPLAGWQGELLRVTLLFLFAFCLRFLFLSEISSSPLFEMNVAAGTDMRGFIDWASRIINGDWLGQQEGAFWQGPAYPYFLAAIFALLGRDLFLVGLLQMVLGALTCVLIYYLGRALFDEQTGLVAGIIAVGYGLFIFYGAILHSTTLEIFLATAMLLQLTRSLDSPRPTTWLFSGILLGLACLARPNILLYAPFLLTALWIRERRDVAGDRRAIKVLAAVGGGMAIVLAPVTIHNYLFGQQFVLVSAGGPETFRIANSYDSTRLNFTYPTLPQMPIFSWYFLKHQLAKAILFWWGYEVPQNVNYYLFREFSAILKLPLFPFWIVAPMGLLGIALASKNWNAHLHVFAFMASYYLSVVLFFIIGRFRLPMLPPLIVFAAYAVTEGYRRLKVGEARRVWIGGLVVLALTMRPWTAELVRSKEYWILGGILADRGRYGEAIIALRKAGERGPRHPKLNEDLGLLLAIEGRYDEAAPYFERELRIDPESASAHRHLGILYMDHRKDKVKALFHLQRSLQLAPEGGEAGLVRRRIEALEGSASRVAN